jgi:hypothetical protein
VTFSESRRRRRRRRRSLRITTDLVLGGVFST